MCKKTEKLARKIIEFVNNDVTLDYLGEINNYGNLLVRISKKQPLESTEVNAENAELAAEYDFHKEKISGTFLALKKSLEKSKLKKSLKEFCDPETGRVQEKYGEYIELIELTKFFAGIVRNHDTDHMKMTLGERITNLKEMNSTNKQMLIAELTSLKKHSQLLEERAHQVK